MKLHLTIALRYLFSKKRHNAVNIISLISVAGIGVASMAMIVVLSVFNGFSGLAQRQLSRIDPPLAVIPDSGKVIRDADSIARDIRTVLAPGSAVIPVIKEQALAISGERQIAVNALAVPDEFITEAAIDSIIIDGVPVLQEADTDFTLSSIGVALALDVRPGQQRMIEIYVPRRTGKISAANPASAFRGDTLLMSAVYQVDQEGYDTDMMIIPLAPFREMLQYTDEATALWIYPEGEIKKARGKIESVLPAGLSVKNRIEQQAESFRMISVEKWITFLMLTFILIITSFNIISTMSMIIIEKEGNASILLAMGATPAAIRKIYALQGMLISILGGCAGIITGVALTLSQQFFGIIKLNTSNPSAMTIDSYPVALQCADIFVVAAVIALTGILTGIASASIGTSNKK